MRARRTHAARTLAALVVVLLAACAAPSRPVEPAPAPRATVLLSRQVDGRMWDVTISSPALDTAVVVRLLLPVRYDAAPSQRWPVLYLLHGCCDDLESWTRSTDVERLTRASDLIVAMPDGGRVGFYSDWLQGPRWETFHTVELPAVLADEARANGRQAVAGVSMGGLGALDYAAHHPGQYGAAASFSGIVHTRFSAAVTDGYLSLVRTQSGLDPDGLWGDPGVDAAVWARHNPYDQVDALRSTRLFVAAGDGRPGPLDPPGATTDDIEASIGAQNRAFAERLRTDGVDAQVDLYGAGTHSWVYWQRELHRAWPLLSQGLGL